MSRHEHDNRGMDTVCDGALSNVTRDIDPRLGEGGIL
jgi:hypothetical protein